MKLVKVQTLIRQITAPRIYHFPELPEVDDLLLMNWGWNQMTEVDEMAIAGLRRAGFQKNPGPVGSIMEYGALNPVHFGIDLPFVGIYCKSEGFPDTGEVHFDPDMSHFTFQHPYLYVPARWASKVIKCATLGIVSISVQDHAASLIAHNGHELPCTLPLEM